MSGDHHRSPALRHHVFDFFPSFDRLDEPLKPVFPDSIQQRGLDEGAPQVLVRFACEILYGFTSEIGECGRDLPLDDAPSYSKRAVSERAEPLADFAGRVPAQRAQRTHRRAHRVVLGAMSERRLSRESIRMLRGFGTLRCAGHGAFTPVTRYVN